MLLVNHPQLKVIKLWVLNLVKYIYLINLPLDSMFIKINLFD